MAIKTFIVEFYGYWRERKIVGIPNKSGIYCVYECTYDSYNDTVSIHRLIYIGEAGKARDRIRDHEKKPEWKTYVRAGNDLCFSFGYVESKSRERVEAAFIHKHKPPVNTDYVDEFPFDTTTIKARGRTMKLSTDFTVSRSD